MADLRGYIKVFSNITYDNLNYAIDNDFVIYTQSNSQRIIVGQNSNLSIIATSNRVGFFKSNPNYTLDVLGNINFTGNFTSNGIIFPIDDWSNNSSNLFILSPSNLGIGISNPQYNLDVIGDINSSNGIIRRNGLPFSVWAINSSNFYKYGSNIGIWNSNPAYTLDVNGDINFTGIMRSNTVQYPIRISQWSNISSNIFILSSNVGINDSNPAYPLEIIGDLNISGTLNRYGKNNRYMSFDESDSNLISTQCNNSILKYSPLKWFTSIDGMSNDTLNGIAVDTSNNIYITGAYSSCNVGNSIIYNYDNTIGFNLPNAPGALTAYAVKYNSSGVAQWYILVDSAGGSNSSASIAVDSQQNVYITGTYTCNAIIYNSNYVSSGYTLRTPTVNSAAFTIKYDSNGICQWFVSMDGGSIKAPSQVQVDSNYNVYFGGAYGSNPTLYNSNNTVTAYVLRNTTTGSYAVKYDSNGVCQWFVTADSTSTESNMGLKIDTSNNLYIVRKCASTTVIYNSNNVSSGISIRTATGGNTGYLIKYDSNGILVNYASIDGVGADLIYAVDIDADYNVYVAGIYTNNCIIYDSNNIPSSNIPRTASGQAVIIVKYDSNFISKWFTTIDGSGLDSVASIAVDKNKNFYACGSYLQSNPIIYNAGNSNSGLQFTAPVNANTATFIVKYNSNGEAQWHVTVDGINNDSFMGVFPSPDGSNVYVGGTINNGLNTSSVLLYYNNIQCQNSIRYSSNNVGLLFNLYSDKNYKLISNLTSTSNGFYKYITNVTSSNINISVRNSTDTTTLKTLIVPAYSNKMLSWYNSNWYELTDKSSWISTNPSNVYIIGSNVGFGKSNPGYNIDIVGDLNISGNIRSYCNLTGNYLTYETDQRYISTKCNASILKNLNILWIGSIIPQTGYVTGKTLTLGSNGNIYIAGGYSNTSNSAILFNSNGIPSGITFNNNSNYSLSNGIYWAKYNSNCQAQWVKTIDNVGASGIINSIATDSNENIFVAGTYISATPILLVSTSNNGPSNIYPPGPMVSNQTNINSNYYTAGASSERTTGTQAWQVYNKVITSDFYAKWQSVDGCYSACNATTNPAFPDGYLDPNYKGEWLRLDMPFPIYPNSLSFAGDIMAFRMYGWNYTGNWDVLLDITSRSNAINYSNIDIYNININPPKIYQRYALRFNKSRSAAGFNRACVMWVEINGNKLPSLPMSSNYSSFLIKYDSNGTAKWATGVDGTAIDTGTGVVVDNNGNSYLSGVYTKSNAAIYNSNAISSNITPRIPTGTSNFGYIVKFNPGGISQWCICTDGNYSTFDALRIDSNGSLYAGGTTVLGNVVIYNSSNVNDATIRASDGSASYLIKFDSNGTTQWFTSIGAPSNNGTLSSTFQTNAVSIDSNGNSYIVGHYNNNGFISQIYNSNNVYSGSNFRSITGNTAGFLVKYDSNGYCKWFTSLDSTANDSFVSAAVDLNGSVFVSGCNLGSNPSIYNSNNTLSPYSFINSNSSAYVLKYNSNGILTWFTVYHTMVDQQARSTNVDSNGNLFVLGNYNSSNAPGRITIGNDTCGIQLMQTSNIIGYATYFTKYDTNPFTYKLLTNLGTSNNGFYKYILNASSNDAIIDIRDSNDTTTLRKITVPSKSNKILTWYGSNWYGLTSKGYWSNVSSIANCFIIGTSVGIGKSNPGYNLDIIGDINVTDSFAINGSKKAQNQWISNTNSLYIIGSNIGIYRSNPSYSLDIGGDVNVTGTIRSNGVPITYRQSQWSNTSSNVYILASNVGINTSNPQYTLDVNGSINVSSNLYINGISTNFTMDDSDSLIISTTCNVSVIKNSPLVWYTSVDGSGFENGTCVVVDVSNNVYIGGSYGTGATTIYNKSNVASALIINAGSNNTSGVYAVKYNSNGIAQWFVTADGASNDVSTSIAVDINQNLYLSGYTTGASVTIFNSNNTPSGQIIRSSTGQSGFVIKYDSNGICQWFVSIDGAGTDQVLNVKTDNYGNVYFTGIYSSSNTIFYNSNNTPSGLPTLLTSVGNAGYLAKYDSNGTIQWFVTIDSTGNDIFSAMDIDSNLNVYMAGYTTGSATIYNSNNTSSGLSLRATSNSGAFLIKYDSNGICQNFASIDGSSIDQGFSIKLDGNNNIYVGGVYSVSTGPLYIYDSNNLSTNISLRPATSTAAFVIKFDSNFNCTWFATADSSSSDAGQRVNVDINNNVYLTGYYSTGPLLLFTSNVFTGYSIRAGTGFCGFFIKYDSNGTIQNYGSIDSSGTDNASNCAISPNGSNLYLTGIYAGTASIYVNNILYDTIRTSSSSAAYLVNLKTDFPNYKISSSSNITNGFYKYLINASQCNVSINVINSNDTTTLNTITIPSYSNKILTYYNSNWYESTDKSPWSNTSSIVYLTNSNVGIGKSNPNYTLDINGTINLTGNFRNYGTNSLTTFGVDVKDYRILNSSNISMLQNLNINGSGKIKGINTLCNLGGNITGRCSTISSNGNIYIAGIFTSPSNVILYNSDATISGIGFCNITSNGCYVAKYDSNCIAKFNKIFESGFSAINCIQVDSNENIYIAGVYTSTSNMLLTTSSNWPVSNYPPNLNSNDSIINGKLYSTRASTENSIDLQAWRSFDGIENSLSNWQSASSRYSSCNASSNPNMSDGTSLTYTGEWIELTLPFSIFPTQFIISGDMMDFRLYGYATTSTWNMLNEVINRTSSYYTKDTYTIGLSSLKLYSKYAVKINKAYEFAGSGTCSVNTFSIYGSILPRLPFTSNTGAFAMKCDSNFIPQWGVAVDSDSADTGTGVSIDENMNLYFSGAYNKSNAKLYEADGAINSLIQLRADYGIVTQGFIIKYNSNGYAQWCTSIGGYNTYPSSIKYDSTTQYLYAGGQSYYDIRVYNMSNILEVTEAHNAQGGFLLTLNSNGNALWLAAVNIPNGGNDSTSFSVTSMDVYNGDACIKGNYRTYGTSNYIIYNSNSVNSGLYLRPSAIDSCFLIKWNSNGICTWFATQDAAVTNPMNGLCIDTFGNIYTSVKSGGSSNLIKLYNANNLEKSIPAPSNNTIILKYNSLGSNTWYSLLYNNISTACNISCDSNGNVVVAGTYSSSNSDVNISVNGIQSTGHFLRTTTSTGTSNAAYFIKYDTYPITYKLINNLSTSSNGIFKYILNISSNNLAINICDSNDATTLQTFTVPAYSNKIFTWYGSNWYGLTDTNQWSTNSSNIFIISSNIGIGLSNPQYNLDVVGDLNNSNGYLKINTCPIFGWYANGSNIYSSNYNISIGKSNATYPIDIVGDVNFTGTLRSNTIQYPITMTQWSNNSSNLFINSSNVCINKSNSIYPLDMIGDINVSGNITRYGNTINNLTYTDTNENLVSTTSNLSVLYANQLNWYAEVDGGVVDSATGVTVDNYGNVYVSGNTGCNLAVPTVIYNLNGVPSGLVISSYLNVTTAAYAVKYDSNGIAQWYVMVDSLGTDTGLAINIDNNLNVYIGGTYSSNATIFNSNGVSSGYTLRTPTSGTAGYVVKFDSNGLCQWFISVDATGSDTLNRLAIDKNNNLIISGTYSNSALAFYNSNNVLSAITLPSTTLPITYLARYNSNGVAFWSARIQSATVTLNSNSGLALDSSNDIYISGSYNGIGPTIYNASNTLYPTLPRNGSIYCAYMIKYSSAGYCQGFVTVDANGSDQSTSVSVDSNYNIYLTGLVTGAVGATIYNSNNTAYSPTLRIPVQQAGYVVKFDSNLMCQWFTTIDGAATEVVTSASIDSNMNVYVVGNIGSTSVVANIYNSNNILSPLSPPTSNSAFMMKFDSNGTAQWFLTMSGGSGAATFSNCKINSSGKNLYIAGTTGTISGGTSFYVNNSFIASTRRNSNAAAMILNVNTDLINYKLLSLTTSGNGFTKSCINTALTDGILNIRDSNDTITLRTSSLIASSNKSLTSYSSNWYEYVNTSIWNSNGANLYLLNSNLCIGKSNTIYSLDIAGVINAYNIRFNNTQNTLLTSMYETPIISTNNSNFIALSNNIYDIITTGIDGYGTVTVQCSKMDNFGNIYTSGTYSTSNALIFNNSNTNSGLSINTPSNNTTSAFAVKYNSNGIAQWFVNIDGAGWKDGYSIAVDSNLNVYIGGTYAASNPLIIYNSNNTPSGLSIRAAGGDYGIYGVKFDSNGICQWFVSADSTSTDGSPNTPVSVAVDSNMNFYLSGFGNNPTIYDSNNTTALSMVAGLAGRSAFCIKYNSNGISQWYTGLGGGSSIYSYAITTDNNMNVYMAGNYASAGTAVIYNSNGVSSGSNLRAISGGQSAYLIKYNSNGIMQWFTSVDGTNNEYSYGVATDSNLNVYMCGMYINGASVIYNSNNTASPYTFPAVASVSSPYLVKFDSNGVCQWYTTIAPTGNSIAMSVCTDTANVYVGGYYQSTTNVNVKNSNNTSSPFYLVATNANNINGAYIIKYDSNGICKWCGSIAQNGASVNGTSISIDGNNNMMIAGTYSGTTSNAPIYSMTTPQGYINMVTYGISSRGFVAKYKQSTVTQKLLALNTSSNGLFKNLLNVYNTDLTVNIRDSNDSITLRTLNIPSKSNVCLTFYGSNWYGLTDTSQWSNTSSNVFIMSSNVGIGLSNPGYQLELSTDNAAKPSTNLWTISSDERIKDGIVLADLDTCVQIIKTLPLKKYTFRQDLFEYRIKDYTRLGWIAQDVEKVFPKAVKQTNQYGIEDCRTLDTDQLYASMYGCLKKQQQLIEELEKANEILLTRISVLETQTRIEK